MVSIASFFSMGHTSFENMVRIGQVECMWDTVIWKDADSSYIPVQLLLTGDKNIHLSQVVCTLPLDPPAEGVIYKNQTQLSAEVSHIFCVTSVIIYKLLYTHLSPVVLLSTNIQISTTEHYQTIDTYKSSRVSPTM